ncbi:MAG TPA: GNAT family N-acetyltransferase [Candidatus Limnocylindria bacterium]|nr:GNAT family N-acetyltransferase [Candidatus Limnocylindria bacterium]
MTQGFAAPLTDVSDAGFAAAIEADQIATRVLAPEVPVEIHDDPDATWGIARYPDPFRSVVVSARFAEEDADRRVAEIAAAFEARGTGFLWWLAPFHQPAGLDARLVRAGLQYEGKAPAMAMDLEALPRDEPLPAGLTIEPVTDVATLREFIQVLADEMGIPEGVPNPAAAHHAALLEAIPPTLAGEPVPLRYLGRIDGRTVATSRIAIAAGVAGLYAVATLPEARGRGIGRAMTVAALQAARSIGLRIGALQASDSGLPVYRRLGFRTIFEYEVYLRLR